MKIIAVGMNYAQHNKEMKISLLEKDPVIFTKPDSALLRKGRPFFIPDFAERFDYECELVVKINRQCRDVSERFCHRYYRELTLGIDFTARDLQERLRSGGLPWDLCKGFDNSAAVGRFIDKSDLFSIAGGTSLVPEMKSSKGGGQHVSEETWRQLMRDINFRLDIDGKRVQQGNTSEMIHSVDKIISYVSRFMTLKSGDLIFTGTPAGVGPLHEGEELKGFIGEEEVLKVEIA